ncbi:MAG: GAF domain-containing protein [Variovorax sp.]|jgi:GAF domain-containing protein|nr:MAG: GAF domain-containing protein [Variovorax sp.]
MPDSLSSPTASAFAKFVVTHRTQGLRAALATLVKMTDYRFIGLWRFQDGKANAVVHYDREDPSKTTTQEVPDTATYCCFVRDTKAPFKTPNALIDERLASHSAREQVTTYCGVPVMDSLGNVLATLCHYDVVPRDPDQVNLELMLMVAAYVANNGNLPPYPSTSATTAA